MRPGRSATTFILVTLVLDAMGIGLILPVMPDLIEEIAGASVGDAAVWGGILATVFAVMQFLFHPLLGALADAFGRRPVLLTSLAVMCVDYVVMALAGSIWLLVLTRVIGGITAATYSTATAALADMTPPERKAQTFGLVGAAFGVGFILGPVVGGLLAEWGTRAPFVAAAVLSGANLVLGWFALPETVTDRIRRPFDLARAHPLGAFRAVGRLPHVSRLLILFFLYEFAFIVYPAVWAFFAKERFGWTPGIVGASLAAFGVGVAIVQGGLIRVVLRRLGERGTILYGIVFNLMAFAVLAVIEDGRLALAFIPVTALGAVVTPALMARMSKLARDDQQGELQGVIASAKSMAAIFAPFAMTQTFAAFADPAGVYAPGAPFVLSAMLMVLCLAVFLGARDPLAKAT